MAVETADYITELDKNLPRGADSISEGDIHLRTIKDVLKRSFPNVDSPVNGIHTSATAPTLHSPGTVWFDTSTGLIKMRDKADTEWLNMAHGEAGGIGSTLKIDYVDWSSPVNFRASSPTKVKSTMINPLSPTSTILFKLDGSVSAWGDLVVQTTYVQLRDVTNDQDITPAIRAAGFNHVDDPGNFEVYTMLSLNSRLLPHPPTEFEVGLYAWSMNSADGGAGLENLNAVISEIE